MSDFRLKVFHTVATLRSFSKAAKVLYITQPAVSIQIKSLEEEFGSRLFIRDKKDVIPTHAGEILLNYAHKILGLYQEAEREIGLLTDTLKDKLALGMTAIIGTYHLPAILDSFKRKYPDVEVVTLISNTENIIKALKEGICDLCIVSEPVHEHQLVREVFLRDELVLIVPPSHKWANRDFVKLEEIIHEPMLIREEGSGTRETIKYYLAEEGLKISDLTVSTTLGATSAIKAAVENGLGIAFIGRSAIKLELRMGSLKALAIDNMNMYQSFTLMYPKVFNKPAVERFLQCIRELARRD